jgi:hypothetical protein
MRDLSAVIDKLLETIPKSEKSLIAELDDIKSSYEFASPELRSMWWREAAEILANAMKTPTKDWEWDCCDIFADKKFPRVTAS